MEKPATRPTRERRNGAPSKRWSNTVAAALPVIACVLGGATEKWAEGIVLVLLGLLVLADPPRFSPGRVINGAAIGLLVCAGLAFLPSNWFFQPEWRSVLADDFGLALPNTVSAQPWATLQCTISLVAGLTWFYYVCCRDAEPREMRYGIRLYAAGIVLLAALCLALHFAHAMPPFWHNERRFGPFPNRNQTADLFALAAVVVLACGADDLRNRNYRWIAWAVSFVVLVGALALGFSRAGILLLILGVAVWIAVVTLRKGSAARLAFGISILLVLLAALLLFGGQTLERFHLRGDGAGMSSDFRWLIFRDALQLIRASPWSGVGLGNFEPIFAIFRSASRVDTRSHHPESDWIWLWSELGWIALTLTIVAALLLLWRAFPRDESRNYRLRLGGFVAAALFAIHGLFDVSGHRVGTAMGAVFLLGAALPRDAEARTKWLPFLFRFVAVALIVCGAAWTASVRWQRPLPGSLGAEMLRDSAASANRSRNYAEATTQATTALAWTPLDWQLYFVRALAEANQRDRRHALDDFRRARFLEPNAYEVPLEEGIVWSTIDARLALPAWREALERAGSERAEAYARMLRQADQFNPRLLPRLHELSMAHSDLVLTYLSRLHGDPFNAAIAELLAKDPELAKLSDTQRAQLLEMWSERGDLAQLAQLIQRHPDWLPAASSGVEKFRAEQRDFRGAVELALRFGVRPALPQITTDRPPTELQQTLAIDPANYAVGFALYRQQRQHGQLDDALLTVRHFTESKRAPAYFYYLEADCWAAKGEWERAWAAYQKFAAATRK